MKCYFCNTVLQAEGSPAYIRTYILNLTQCHRYPCLSCSRTYNIPDVLNYSVVWDDVEVSYIILRWKNGYQVFMDLRDHKTEFSNQSKVIQTFSHTNFHPKTIQQKFKTILTFL